MKKSFQLVAYTTLAILGALVIIHDGDIIWCIRCGSFIPDLIGIIAAGIGLTGFVGTLATKNRAANSAKGY